MTVEEKAKRYDEALEIAKKNYVTAQDLCEGSHIGIECFKNTLESIFPELKESEDEKIRRWIIDDIRYNINNEPLNNSEYKKKAEKAIAWLEKQRDKDKLIQELGEYKVKYTQEVLEKYINSMSNKDDERLRKTAIAFLKDFAEQGYENAVECIDWLEKQGKDKEINNFDVLPGLYKCIHRMFDGTPDGRLLFEIGNVYKCISKHDRAEFEVSYGHSVYLEDPVVCKHFIPFKK